MRPVRAIPCSEAPSRNRRGPKGPWRSENGFEQPFAQGARSLTRNRPSVRHLRPQRVDVRTSPARGTPGRNAVTVGPFGNARVTCASRSKSSITTRWFHGTPTGSRASLVRHRHLRSSARRWPSTSRSRYGAGDTSTIHASAWPVLRALLTPTGAVGPKMAPAYCHASHVDGRCWKGECLVLSRLSTQRLRRQRRA